MRAAVPEGAVQARGAAGAAVGDVAAAGEAAAGSAAVKVHRFVV